MRCALVQFLPFFLNTQISQDKREVIKYLSSVTPALISSPMKNCCRKNCMHWSPCTIKNKLQQLFLPCLSYPVKGETLASFILRMSLWFDENKIKDRCQRCQRAFFPSLSPPRMQLLDVCAVIYCALFNSVSQSKLFARVLAL